MHHGFHDGDVHVPWWNMYIQSMEKRHWHKSSKWELSLLSLVPMVLTFGSFYGLLAFFSTNPTSSGNVAPLLRHQMRGEALKGFGRNPKPYMDSNCSDRSVIELVVKPVYDWIWFDNLPTSSLEIEKNRATTIKAESHRWTTTCLHVFYDLFLQHAPGVPLTHHHPNRFHASTFWRQKLWLLGKLRHGWWNWPPKNSRIIGPLSQLRLWGTLDGDEECYVH